MRYLSVVEVIRLHAAVVADTGGARGIRDIGALESAVAQPRMAMAGADLYQAVEEKAVALCFSPILNHPFEDGNKRIGHAAMEVFLNLNRYEFSATVADAESMILDLAAGKLQRDIFIQWVRECVLPA